MNPTSPDALDADVLAALAEATPAEALAPAAAARIKHGLMARIAAAETRHLTVPADGGQWQPFAAGVQIKVLHEAGGVMSYLLRLAPGASIAPHRHPIDEECVVLEGTVRIGDDLVVHAGGFHLARRGLLHAPIHAPDGATLFLRGAAPEVGDLV
jgi:quercetin dioxygenase-like cupin family protein